MSNGDCFRSNPRHKTLMFDSYEKSVMAHADCDGKLPAQVIRQLFEEHGSDFADYSSTVSNENWDDGVRVLNWLGY